MGYIYDHMQEATQIIKKIDIEKIESIVNILVSTRNNNGRLFILGVGGSAANASHAVNDFRKICGIEAYAPTDNVSELTARTNDEGWNTVFIEWLRGSKLKNNDTVFILSVGGGNKEKNISTNLINALTFSKDVGANIIGIVGRDGGFTAKISNDVCIIPTINEKTITPHTEAFHSVIWHAIVSHPKIKKEETKWESVK